MTFLTLKKLQQTSFLMLVIGVTCFSCQHRPDYDKLSTDFVVATNYDPNANFGDYKTYTLSDTIKIATSKPNDTIMKSTYSAPLITTIVNNMTARGYTRVNGSENPDLLLNVTGIKDTQYYTYYYSWGYYPYYYYPYYPYSYTSSYTVGSLIIDMADRKNAGTDHRIRAIWRNVGGGVLGSGMSAVTQAQESINKAFTQSPYIQTSK